LFPHIEPGLDDFKAEKQAIEIEACLNALPQRRQLPLAPDFKGLSPMPVRLRSIASDVLQAEFNNDDHGFQVGLDRWLTSLGKIERSRFFVLAGNRVRYEIASSTNGRLEYRVGHWQQIWSGDRLSSFRPLEEIVTIADKPLFADVTSQYFSGTSSFHAQMLRGVPFWRSRIDSASGIDLYGSNGIAVGDIDGDGQDEIYISQPAGLPNRLYKVRSGRLEDITEAAGLAVLDDTSSALFVDFRNTGRPDLLIATASGPEMFINDGGAFRHNPEAFRFATPRQGTSTSMAAADYDRDGKVDVYLCTYIYYQSEDQYTYPVPYHDARNGPPNYLF